MGKGGGGDRPTDAQQTQSCPGSQMARISSSALPSLQRLLVKYILRAGQALDTEINKEDIRRANGLTKEARQQGKYIKKHNLQKVLKEMNKRATASREIIQGIPMCEKMTHHSIIHLFIEFTQMFIKHSLCGEHYSKD